MVFSSTTSRGRGRLGSSSTSSLSSIGTPPAADNFYSLSQPQFGHQHLQHSHSLSTQYSPPIDPQLFGIAGGTTLPETSFASSSVIAGEVVAGGTASDAYSDTERLPSLGISVSGDEEEEERRGSERGLSAIKLEEIEHSHHSEQQQFGEGIDSAHAVAGISGELPSWNSDRLREEEDENMLAGRQLHSDSTVELSEPEVGDHSDSELDEENDREDSESATSVQGKEPTPTPPPPPPPTKRRRGRPRKNPLPTDEHSTLVQTPMPKQSVTLVEEPEDAKVSSQDQAQGQQSDVSESSSKASTRPQSDPTPNSRTTKTKPEAKFRTPKSSKRGPGRPKGSSNKFRLSTSSNGSNNRKRKSTSSPRTSIQSAATFGEYTHNEGNLKRGPGRPRKSVLANVENAEEQDDEQEEESAEGGFNPGILEIGHGGGEGGGGGRGRSTVSAAESTNRNNASTATNTNGCRRSARERRSVNWAGVNTASLAEEDKKAPVMGQGCLKKKKKLPGHPVRMHNGNTTSAGEEEDGESRAERRGYMRKAEMEKFRRGKITTKLQPPITHHLEQLPNFPPEYGFKISPFRGSTPGNGLQQSSTPSAASQPTATATAQPQPIPRSATTSSLPTPPSTNDEPESYSNSNNHNDEPPRKKQRIWVGETEEGYEPITCLYTFSPTAEVFQDFEGFVKAVSCVGKRQGCVRVRVPRECIPEPGKVDDNYDNDEEGEKGKEGRDAAGKKAGKKDMAKVVHNLIHRPPQQIATSAGENMAHGVGKSMSMISHDIRIEEPPDADDDSYKEPRYFPGDDPSLLYNTHQHLSLNTRCTTYNPIYDVTTNRTFAIPATDFLSRRAWRDGVVENSPQDLYPTEATDENRLIERGLASLEEENELNKITYSTDNEATPELRSMFNLSDLKLSTLSGNSLFKSDQQVAGIHTPYFYFASPASVFAMHMEDYAALSINFHHWGAPKRWVICCPADSEKLENLVSGMLGLKHTSCDQFIRHASVFVPTWVLERAGVRYTQVLQEPGDMILTFPWAYHEGWNQGLNVAEAIGYGDVSWERWVRGYRICGKRCPLKPIEMRFPEGFGEGGSDDEREQEGDEEEEERRREEEEEEGREREREQDEYREYLDDHAGTLRGSADDGEEEEEVDHDDHDHEEEDQEPQNASNEHSDIEDEHGDNNEVEDDEEDEEDEDEEDDEDDGEGYLPESKAGNDNHDEEDPEESHLTSLPPSPLPQTIPSSPLTPVDELSISTSPLLRSGSLDIDTVMQEA